MTAGEGGPGEQPQVQAYDLILRVREAVPTLATPSLDRIRVLVERALAGGQPSDEVIAELAQTLARDA